MNDVAVSLAVREDVLAIARKRVVDDLGVDGAGEPYAGDRVVVDKITVDHVVARRILIRRRWQEAILLGIP